MDVAEQIVVMNDGHVEQAGRPTDLYDHPETEFVMSFVGTANKIGDRLVRPHDVELFTSPTFGAQPALLKRITRLGFEVKVDLDVGGDEAWAQVTRGTCEQLGLDVGGTVYVRRAGTQIRVVQADEGSA